MFHVRRGDSRELAGLGGKIALDFRMEDGEHCGRVAAAVVSLELLWRTGRLKVTFRSVADLREYFGREPVELQLAEDATLHSLLQVIAQRWGPQLPAYMWDAQQNVFRGPILLLVNKKVVLDLSTALRDGQEVTVMHALAGG